MTGSHEPQTGLSSKRTNDGYPGSAGGDVPGDARHELRYSDELKRKALHLLALIIPLFMWFAGKAVAIFVLGFVALIAVAADVLRVRSERFAGMIYRFFAAMMRPEECPAVGGPVVFNGATWVVLSATLLVVIFPLEIAIISFTTFMLADAAAAIVGRRFGQHRWRHTTRTVEGTAAFLVVGFAVVLLFGWTFGWIGMLAVVAGAAAEIPYRPLNDNIRVPLVIGTVLYAAHLFAS